MTMRTCDGTDLGVIMYIDAVGDPMDNPEFAVTGIPCDCGTIFDDTKHDLVWPHRYVRPAVPERVMTDLPDIARFL